MFLQFPSPGVHKSMLLSPSPVQRPPSPSCSSDPQIVVLDTSADLILEARFRGNYFSHEWVYIEDDPTFFTGHTSLFTPALVTNVGQTFTIPAGSASHRVWYYGPYILPIVFTSTLPSPENRVIVASFGKCTTTCMYSVTG